MAAKLRSQARRTGRSFRDVVNEALRRGLATPPVRGARPAFAVKVRDLGALRPGLSLDNIGELLERVEGPLHR